MFASAGSPRNPKGVGGEYGPPDGALCVFFKEARRKKLFYSSAFWSMQRPYFGWRVRVTHAGCAVGGVAQEPGLL